jgi:multiple sugar transport system substrate-binding protein
VELLYMTHSHDPANAVNDQLIQEFQELHPNVTITYDNTPHANYEQAVLTAFAGGAGPDIFWAGDWMMPQFIESDILDEIQPAAYDLSSPDEFTELYEEGSLTAFVDDSADTPRVLTAGISEYNTFSLIYHPSHFEEAGIPLPSETEPMTWEQFADIAEQLTVLDGESRVRSGTEWNYPGGSIWTVLQFEPMLHQLGGQVIDPDTGEANFTSPEMQQVMQFVQDLRFERNVTDPAFVVDLTEDFANERVSMMISGPWALPALSALNPDANIAVAPLPVFDGGTRTTTLYSWAWFINKQSSEDKRCWAWNFASFLTSKAQVWWDEVGYIQPRTDLTVEGESLSDYRVGTLPGLDVFLEDFSHGTYQFRSTQYFQISAAWNRAVQRILEGEDVTSVLESTRL